MALVMVRKKGNPANGGLTRWQDLDLYRARERSQSTAHVRLREGKGSKNDAEGLRMVPETPDTWFEKPFLALTKGGKIRYNFGTLREGKSR